MTWVRAHRAYLIGVGTIVVATVAICVAIASNGPTLHRRVTFAINSPFGRRIAPRYFLGGPFGGGRQPYGGPVVPRLIRPGGPLSTAIGPLGLGGGFEHGKFVAKGPTGTEQTVDVQRGAVSKVGSGSITITSTDGFSATYSVSAALANGVRSGDEVLVEATESGGKASVTRLVEVRDFSRSFTGGKPPSQ